MPSVSYSFYDNDQLKGAATMNLAKVLNLKFFDLIEKISVFGFLFDSWLCLHWRAGKLLNNHMQQNGLRIARVALLRLAQSRPSRPNCQPCNYPSAAMHSRGGTVFLT